MDFHETLIGRMVAGNNMLAGDIRGEWGNSGGLEEESGFYRALMEHRDGVRMPTHGS